MTDEQFELEHPELAKRTFIRILRDGLHSLLCDKNVEISQYKYAEALVEAMVKEIEDA